MTQQDKKTLALFKKDVATLHEVYEHVAALLASDTQGALSADIKEGLAIVDESMEELNEIARMSKDEIQVSFAMLRLNIDVTAAQLAKLLDLRKTQSA